MLTEIILSAALANPPTVQERSPGVMTYKPAELTYRENFPGGVFVYSGYWLPQRDGRGRFQYEHDIAEFWFDDGSVIMIETSPTTGGGINILKRNGADYVTLSYDCNPDRTCEEDYHVTRQSIGTTEGALYMVSNSNAFKSNPQLPAERLKRLGRNLGRRMTRQFYKSLIAHTPINHALDDHIDVQLTPVVLQKSDLRTVLRAKKKLENKLDRP